MYVKCKSLDVSNLGEGKAGDGKLAEWLCQDTSSKMKG